MHLYTHIFRKLTSGEPESWIRPSSHTARVHRPQPAISAISPSTRNTSARLQPAQKSPEVFRRAVTYFPHRGKAATLESRITTTDVEHQSLIRTSDLSGKDSGGTWSGPNSLSLEGELSAQDFVCQLFEIAIIDTAPDRFFCKAVAFAIGGRFG